MKKLKVGIIGTGNIGTDLLMKIKNSEVLQCTMFAGRNPESEGIKIAGSMGIPTSINSINAIINNPDCCDIVLDATDAKAHLHHAQILKELDKFTIDLTPSRVGKMCIPALNLDECLNSNNINLVTCGGQASVPIAYAIFKAQPDTEYIEIAASISSKSAGPGTRANIDEYTQTTKDAVRLFTGVKISKSILSLNPAEPPVLMHNTIYALIKNPDMDKIKKEVKKMENAIKEYVPGYKVSVGPIYENGRVVTIVEVVGAGDFLPAYSGNLDIITCAAVKVAEEYAKLKINQGSELDE